MQDRNRRKSQTRSKAAITILFAVAALIYFAAAARPRVDASAMGPSPSFTGAPLENNCTVCHTTNPVNTGSGNIAITGVPAAYVPGQEIELTVVVTKEDTVIYGFQLTAVGTDGDTVGTFTVPSEPVPRTQVVPFTNDDFSRTYVQHTSDGVTGTAFGSNAWTFRWTAPAAAVGAVGFFASGNAADGDGSPSGDFIYTTAITLQAESALVTVGGRVFTDDGRGLSKATVRLTDAQGNIRSVITSSLGFYSFSDVQAGAAYTITASSKRFRFNPVNITPSGDLTNLDLTGIE